MKHKKQGRKLGRIKKQRVALQKSLLGSLILHEKIITTEAKAKEFKPAMDKLITYAKRVNKVESGKVTAIRLLSNRLPKVAARKLMGDFLQKFDARESGYTRIVKLGQRKSDSAKMAVIEFV